MKRSKLSQPPRASISSQMRWTSRRLCAASSAVRGGNVSAALISCEHIDMDPTNMHQALAGRAVLVTGAARRIGAALARGFHAHGAAVCIHCHQSVGEAEHLRDELNRQRAGSAAI